MNVAIGLALVLAGAHLNVGALGGVENAHISMLDRLAIVNLFLAAFNMIPAFPMDGGRVLRALLASRMGHTRATETAAAIGQFVAFLLGFAGLFWNPLLIFIAVFVYLAASSEAHMVALRAMAHGVPVTNAMMTRDRATHPAGACGRGGADALAHQPERVSGGRPATASRSGCSAAATSSARSSSSAPMPAWPTS